MKSNKIHKLNPQQAFNLGVKEGRADGVEYGFMAFSTIMLVALNNTYDDYVSENKIGEFAIAIENELNRIFTEELNSDPENIDVLMYLISKIRQKWGMEAFDTE